MFLSPRECLFGHSLREENFERKELALFLSWVEVAGFELILILGKNGGQICKANFLCSLTFTK